MNMFRDEFYAVDFIVTSSLYTNPYVLFYFRIFWES